MVLVRYLASTVHFVCWHFSVRTSHVLSLQSHVGLEKPQWTARTHAYLRHMVFPSSRKSLQGSMGTAYLLLSIAWLVTNVNSILY